MTPPAPHRPGLHPSTARILPSSLASQERAAADYMAAIEGAQESPGDNELGSLAIEELMERLGVPGVSIAVIKDFDVHWAKAHGIADVETVGARTVCCLPLKRTPGQSVPHA